MKRFILTLILILCSVSVYAYTLETSRGEIELTVPEGVTLEEAYYEMAKLYLEERFDHEKLISSSEKMIKEYEEYSSLNDRLKEENKVLLEKYEKTLSDYEDLLSLYREKNKREFLRPLLGAGYIRNFEGKDSLTLGLGAMVNERYVLHTSVGLDSISIGFGMAL